MLKCSVCDSLNIADYHYFEKEDQQYVECKNCNLIFVKNIKNPDSYKIAYSGDFFKILRRKLFNRFRKFNQYGHFDNFLKKANKATNLAGHYVKKSEINLLDIGCNKGYLLYSGIKRGWNVFGVELIKELLVPLLNEKPYLKDKLFYGRFEDNYNKIEKNKYDIITAIDVVEHFSDIIIGMKNIFDLLNNDGCLIVQTVDTDLKPSKVWGALTPNEHLFLFNKNNFTILCKKIGFKHIEYFEAFDAADSNFVAVCLK